MSFIGNWKEKIERYFDVRINLVKIGFIERVSKILGHLIFIFLCLSILLATLLFAGFGSSEFFASISGSRTVGYFITTGIYLLILAFLYLLRKRIHLYFTNLFVSMLTDGDDDDKDEKAENNNTE